MKWVCYYRVSTSKQGRSGLGLEAQRTLVANFLKNQPGEIIAEFTEVESGTKHNRPQLDAALRLCKKERNSALVIAKLDRLARSTFLTAKILASGTDVRIADMPSANSFVIGILACLAQEESRLASVRTSEALKAAKARGVDIGRTGRELAKKHKSEATDRARNYRDDVRRLQDWGATTVRALRDALNAENIESPGGGRWHIKNTHLLLKRLKHVD